MLIKLRDLKYMVRFVFFRTETTTVNTNKQLLSIQLHVNVFILHSVKLIPVSLFQSKCTT